MSQKPKKTELQEVTDLEESPEAEDELDFDNRDLRLDSFAVSIKQARDKALDPTTSPDLAADMVSLPELVAKHSRHLGLSEDAFNRAAMNQGVDLASLVTSIGREGRDVDEVFKTLEDKGMVAFKPKEERKDLMREIRRKRVVDLRGEQIKKRAVQRLVSGEKRYDVSPEALANFRSEPIDFKKIKDPSGRQAAVSQLVFDMGTDAGLSNDQMIAIIANGLGESQLVPDAVNKRDEDSHGVWQFNRNKGEGVGFTVEQLQDPKFQLEKIINAVKTRDNLKGFRNPNANVNDLTIEFMNQFEKTKYGAGNSPKDVEARKRRAAYLPAAKRLFEQASKSAPKIKAHAELDLQKRQEALDLIQKGKRSQYRVMTDSEAAGGDVYNEIAKPGSDAHNSYLRTTRLLTDHEAVKDPKLKERAKKIAAVLAKYSSDTGDQILNTMADRAFQDIHRVGYEHDVGTMAEKLGVSTADFLFKAKQEGTKENKINKELIKLNTRQVALYLTTGKLGVPAFMSFEFMDPDNYMQEDRVGADDGYFTRLFDAASRNRVQIVGLDKKGVPVYRAQHSLEALFDKIDLHLSMSSGAIRRLVDGPESESVVDAILEGSIQGVKDEDSFTKLALDTDVARDSGKAAIALGSAGLLADIFAPDPTFGAAKIASMTGKGVKRILPLLDAKRIPEALDGMGNAATDLIEVQLTVNRAAEAFSGGNIAEGNKLLDQAKTAALRAEDVERKTRKSVTGAMNEVDRIDGLFAMEIGRDSPLLLGGEKADTVERALGFSNFGLSRDFIHPTVERVTSRGGVEDQTVRWVEFLSLSRKIDRLKELATKIDGNDVQKAYLREVSGDVVGDLTKKLRDQLRVREISLAAPKAQKKEISDAVNSTLDFLSSTEAADLITTNPNRFQTLLRDKLGPIQSKLSKQGKTVVGDMAGDIAAANKRAIEIAQGSDTLVGTRNLAQDLVDVTKSIADIAESRGAAHAFVRGEIAKQTNKSVEPVIKSAMNRFEEIGSSKISPVALNFRNQLEEAFPALRGDAAMHVARNLDERLKAISKVTNESLDVIYDSREFKNIIPNLKRKAVGDVDAEDVVVEAIAVDPKFSKLDQKYAPGEEVLTTQKIRDFTRGVSVRLEEQELTDFTAKMALKTVKQLKQVAKSMGLKRYSKLRKSELFETIIREEKKRTFLPKEYLEKNPEAARQFDELKQAVVDAHKNLDRAIDELDAAEASKVAMAGRVPKPGSVARDLTQPAKDSLIESAQANANRADAILDFRLRQLENFRRVVAGKAEDTLSLAEDLDYIPGMTIKVEDGALKVKSIELPEELQKKGLATTLYKIALSRAKKEGLGFESDLNPSPAVQKIYERLIDEGVPFEKRISRNEDGLEIVRFSASKEDIAKISDDYLSTGVRTAADQPQAVDDLADVADFVEDTQKVVRAMEEAPTIEDFMLEINKVARKELNAEQMETVVSWLATKGIKVGHRGALFIADDAANVAQAEEAFAKAFAEYAKGRPPPTPDTRSSFEKVKDRVLSSFASGKNAQADGARFAPSSEIDRVFSTLLMEESPTQSVMPRLMTIVKRSLVDDLPKNLTDQYLLRIAQESFRMGHPISVKELKAKIADGLKKHAANKARGITEEVTIDLPGPVSLGGLMSSTPKATYSLSEIGLGQRNYSRRLDLADTPATRKIALDSQVEAVRELTPSQMIDRHLKTSKMVKRFASRAYIGGDAFDDMRDLPPKVREAIMAGTRMTQQAVGDAVGLIQEGDATKVLQFMTGNPSVKFKSGRSVLSAGHDMMGSAVDSLSSYMANFAGDFQGGKTNIDHFGRLQAYFQREGVGTKLAYDQPGKGDLTQENITKAFRALVFNSGGSQLLSDIFGAARVTEKTTLTPKHMEMLESIFYVTGQISRKGKRVPPNSRDQFLELYKKLDKLFPVENWRSEPGPVANRVTCLIAGHGQAAKARLEWVDLGIAVDAKTADNFKRWIRGEAIDDVGELAKVQQAFQVHGYNPRFMMAAELDGLDFYVPQAARSKLSMALEQAKDPELQKITGSMYDAIGRGLREAESTSQAAAAWSMRYLKTRMVRGHFLLKSRYFWMNTMDHFNQMSQIVGFRPALISTARLIPQTLATNPAVQSALLGIQKAGVDDAGEIMRQTLTKMGDEGADWAAKLLRSSKWRGDLNSLLEGRDGFMVVNGVPHSYKDMRRICVEEGIAASFNTAELGTKIRQAGQMMIDDDNYRKANKRMPFGPTLTELTQIAEDMAEGWSERERFGAVLTLVEMGVEPRKAARLTIDALYDYAGSMSKADRALLVQIFFPFWAFQKNANRQLIDVVFSPKGAYRLGVLRRGYGEGTEFLSHLLYEDMVDPMGINTNIMTDEEKQSYEALKKSLLDEYGVPASQLPAGLRRQIQMAFTGRTAVFEKGQWYKLDAEGRKLREKFPEYRGLFTRSFVERPSRSSMPAYYGTRDAINIPYAMNESNKIFHELLSAQNPNRTFSSFLIPEQSYKAAGNYGLLLTSSYLALARTLTPDDLMFEDDGSDLFTISYPMLELLQPDRAMLAADLAAATGLNRNAPPYRVSGAMAKYLDASGLEILALDERDNPLEEKMEYRKAMEEFREGKIKVLPDDPFLNGAVLVPTKAYYISGGMPALVFKHSPFDELNKLFLKLEKSPQEEQAGVRGEIQKWVRTAGLFDVKDINPVVTAARESYQKEVESGPFEEVKRQTSLDFIDPDDYSDDAPKKSKPSKQADPNEERLKRLRKRDTGETKMDL